MKDVLAKILFENRHLIPESRSIQDMHAFSAAVLDELLELYVIEQRTDLPRLHRTPESGART